MQNSAEKIWTAAQEQLRSMLSGDTYNLWFAPLRASGLDHDCIVLEVANDFCEVWLKDNYMGLLQEVFTMAASQPMHVKFKVVAGGPALTAPAHISHGKAARVAEMAVERVSTELGFNPKNTFDSFVVGN